jgi:hypothetical protein
VGTEQQQQQQQQCSSPGLERRPVIGEAAGHDDGDDGDDSGDDYDDEGSRGVGGSPWAQTSEEAILVTQHVFPCHGSASPSSARMCCPLGCLVTSMSCRPPVRFIKIMWDLNLGGSQRTPFTLLSRLPTSSFKNARVRLKTKRRDNSSSNER